MSALTISKGSVTKMQLRRIHMLARDRGMTKEALYEAAGVGSLRTFSSAQASDLIGRLGGGDRPHPPGHEPVPSRTRRPAGAIRMITQDQIEQIIRLGEGHWLDQGASAATAVGAFRDWLRKDFKVLEVRDLATAARAAQVIAVLKDMHARKEAK